MIATFKKGLLTNILEEDILHRIIAYLIGDGKTIFNVAVTCSYLVAGAKYNEYFLCAYSNHNSTPSAILNSHSLQR